MSTTTEETTELAPLDVSGYVPDENGDSAEVKALKAKVRKVAKKYTDKHGWCGEVTRALKEIGITESREVTVSVVTANPEMRVVTTVNAEKLHGKTVEQQKKVIAETLGDITLRGQRMGILGTMPFPVDSITQWSVPPVMGDGWSLMAPTEGRVNHYCRPDGSYTESRCGSTWNAYEVQEADPDRSTCKRCEARASRETT
jgi:hypothetical protein